MPLSEAHRQEIRNMVPVARRDKPRLIEIIGVYRLILVDELRRATSTAQRAAARQRYQDILGEIDLAASSQSNPITECYRTYCRCVLDPQGHDCRADLATCLDNAALPGPVVKSGGEENEGITADADALS